MDNENLTTKDITDDIEFLNDKLQASVQDLSSFDEYSTEVKSGVLNGLPFINLANSGEKMLID